MELKSVFFSLIYNKVYSSNRTFMELKFLTKQGVTLENNVF